MKIAIPTNDGINLSAHFGRCRQFLIFEARNGEVKLIETRMNAGCHGHGSSDGAVEALKAGGITVVLVDAAGNAEQIVTAFQSGALRPASVGMCQCQH